MKWFKQWWLLVLLVMAFACALGWEKRCQAKADQCRADFDVQLQSEGTSSPQTLEQQASAQQALAAACEPNGYFCRLFSAANLPTMLLVFVGLGATWAAIKTLKAIEKQADAMVVSERAWVVAELIPICARFGGRFHRPAGDSWVQLSNEEIMDGYYLKHRLRITNKGRTAATVLKCEISYAHIGSADLNRTEIPGIIQVLGGNESDQNIEIDIHQFRNALVKEDGDSKKAVEFNGRLEYQHVFSEIEVMTASFRYIYKPEEYRLERVPQPKYQKTAKQQPNLGHHR